jgi:hypothetical protein
MERVNPIVKSTESVENPLNNDPISHKRLFFNKKKKIHEISLIKVSWMI